MVEMKFDYKHTPHFKLEHQDIINKDQKGCVNLLHTLCFLNNDKLTYFVPFCVSNLYDIRCL
jgi:hypothetical protein